MKTINGKYNTQSRRKFMSTVALAAAATSVGVAGMSKPEPECNAEYPELIFFLASDAPPGALYFLSEKEIMDGWSLCGKSKIYNPRGIPPGIIIPPKCTMTVRVCLLLYRCCYTEMYSTYPCTFVVNTVNYEIERRAGTHQVAEINFPVTFRKDGNIITPVNPPDLSWLRDFLAKDAEKYDGRITRWVG